MELSVAPPRRRKRRPMRIDRALLLSLGFITLFFTMLGLLYSTLDTEEERAGMVNALRKVHHSHRSLARTVRSALRLRKPPTPAISAPPSPTLPSAITPTARLPVTPTARPTASVSLPHALVTSILPRPQLFRWGAMAVAPLDAPLVDLLPLPLSRHQQPPPARERPAYLDKPSPELVPMPPPKPKSPKPPKPPPSPRIETEADTEDDSTTLWDSGPAITLGTAVASDEGEAMPHGSHAAQVAAASQPPATQKLKPSEKAKLKSQSFHLGQAKIDELLGRDVDSVLSNLLMEMRGSISCGGRPIMAFREYDELRAASDELASVLPESNDLAQRAGGRAQATGGGASLGRCAVVGNSGVLLDAVAGTAIDAHDTVIRFNAAPTKGFEAYVGSKTTIRIQNVDHLGFKEKQDMALVFSARTDKDVRKFIAHRKKYAGRAQYMFNPEFWCHVWDWVNRKKLKPSSGLAGLVLALHACDAPVSLYGFRHNATTFHYFDKLPTKVTQEEVYWYHPLVEELAVMHELVALGKLTIF